MSVQRKKAMPLAFIVPALIGSSLTWAHDPAEHAAMPAMPIEHAAHSIAPQATAPEDRYTQGEIRKVDMAQNKLTIKHGDIKNLGMPGMTMVFKVKDPSIAKTLKAGDTVRFVVEQQSGGLVITELQKTL